MKKTFLIALALGLGIARCVVHPSNGTGAQCDAAHPCGGGLVCTAAGTCQTTATPEDGGQSDAGDAGDGGDAGPGPSPCLTDAGPSVIWSQCVDGFGGVAVRYDGGFVSVDPNEGNLVTARVPNGDVLHPELPVAGTYFGDAVALVTHAAALPPSAQGQMKGEIFLDAGVLDRPVTFAILISDGGQNDVNLFVTEQLHLGVFSDVLQSPVLYAPSGDAGYVSPGAWHTVDVTWTQNNQVTLSLDGTAVVNQALSGSAAAVTPVQGQLGVSIYGPDAGRPAAMGLRNWYFSTDPGATLP